MDSYKIFNCLLTQIENSRLNYAISKTPFSATISLKCSFSKRFSQNHKNVENNIMENIEKMKVENDEINEESEKLQLKTRVECLEQKLLDQKSIIDQKFENEKKILKVSEEKEAGFRAELLKVKSERKQCEAKVKSFKIEHERMQIEIQTLITEINELKKDIVAKRETIKVNAIEVKKLNMEQVSLEENNANLKSELQALKRESLRELKNESFLCTICSFKTKTPLELKNHIIDGHHHNKESQAEENSHCETNPSSGRCENEVSRFSEYLCFYCEKKIASAEQLEDHRKMCCDQTFKIKISHPCEECGAECMDESDLARHRTAYHELGTWSPNEEKELFWCDVCPLNYTRMIDLQFHKRGCHWN